MTYSNDALTYRFPQLTKLLGLSTRTLRYAIKSGEFPAGKKLVGKVVGWPRNDIETWIASRPSANKAEAAE